MSYRDDYPTRPIGGKNPYHCCSACGASVPEINGSLDGHRDGCSWAEAQRNPVGDPVYVIERTIDIETHFVVGADTDREAAIKTAANLALEHSPDDFKVLELERGKTCDDWPVIWNTENCRVSGL